MKREKEFSELTRVQIPAALHLMRLGYTYLPHNGKELKERDPETNILVSIFREQFLKFNNYATDVDDQNDLGRAFYKRIIGETSATYIDWEHPEANTFHLALEVTCQNGQDEFRPDIVIFVNGLPLSYIELKQPNAIRDGKTGIQSEQDRTRYRFENRKFRRFNNITQLIAYLITCLTSVDKASKNRVLITVQMPIQKPSLMHSRRKEKKISFIPLPR